MRALLTGVVKSDAEILNAVRLHKIIVRLQCTSSTNGDRCQKISWEADYRYPRAVQSINTLEFTPAAYYTDRCISCTFAHLVMWVT